MYLNLLQMRYEVNTLCYMLAMKMCFSVVAADRFVPSTAYNFTVV